MNQASSDERGQPDGTAGAAGPPTTWRVPTRHTRMDGDHATPAGPTEPDGDTDQVFDDGFEPV